MSLNNRRSLLIHLVLLFALVIPSHVVGAARSSDIDEPFWVINGSNYYYALTHRDFANTVYEYHPGVTNTWVIAAGMLAVFPEYRGLGQGYFDPYKWTFEDFMREHGQQTLDLVRASRLIQTALLVLLAALLFFLLQLVLDRTLALGTVVFAFNAPFFLGHSRLLNNEGMLAALVSVSVVAMFVYLHSSRKLVFLLLSGAAFGLAQLTKSPSIVVLFVIGLMLLITLFDRSVGMPPGRRLLSALKLLGLWLLAAAVVYVLLWPGMWVAPARMLYEVYGNAFSYAFQGARLDVTGELQPSSFSIDTRLGGITSYLSRLAVRSTPITWIGLLLSIPMMLVASVKPVMKRLSGYLLLTAVLFILMFGLARGRNSTHYITSTFFALDLVAAMGWGAVIAWLGERFSVLASNTGRAAAFTLLILAQLISGLPYFPYYYTYTNPLMASSALNVPYGYGEGLDLAAGYLAQKQDADGLRAFVYNGMGTFSYFFPGRVQVIKSPYFLVDGMPEVISGMRWSEYVVLYTAVQKRIPEQARFLAVMERVKPEKIITLYGFEYVRIYRTADIPESVYEELAK